jgi:hypothetical protein
MALQPGDRFGRYELVSWLGRGGMAETWRARLVGDAGVTKPVLIKKVLPEFSGDEAFISMFISEARISATLSHGNVAQVFDFGRVDGDYFLAMEFVDGQPLHRILKRAAKTGLPALPIPLATFIALEMCRGLHYAHTRADEKGQPLGIVHRDISPDNVLVSYEGQVKIVDFGIAKARSLRTFDTEPGVVKGKYLFFSPEQARGKEVDARTDVWATGLVLYELLCGQRPVSGPPHTVMMRMASGDFPSPRQVREDLPAELDGIVMRALSVALSQRFESSHAFGDALAEFLYGFAPRVSAMTVAYLVRELFREELAQEERELPVPASFQEELARWRKIASIPMTDREIVPVKPAGRQARGTGVTPAPVLGEDEAPAPARAPALSRGALIAGAGVVLALGAAIVLLPTWGADSPGASVGPPPATPIPRKPVAAVKPAPAPVTGSASMAPDAGAVMEERRELSLELDAQRNVIIVPRSHIGFSELTPGRRYTISEFGDAPARESNWIRSPSASNVPPIFFLLMGDTVPGDSSLGEVTRGSDDFQGASAIAFFTVGAATGFLRYERGIQIWSSQIGSEKQFIFEPESRVVSAENAALLSGLERSGTYSLVLTSDGKGAFLRGRTRAPARRVVCVQATEPGKAAEPVYGWPVAFLLEEGAERLVAGVDALKCGFVDDDPSDNQGHMLIRAVPYNGAGNAPREEISSSLSGEADDLARQARDQLKGFSNRTRNLEETRQVTEQCLRRFPDHADCLLLSGIVLARMGHIDVAATRYRRFVELSPNHKMADSVRKTLRAYDQQTAEQKQRGSPQP